MSAMITQLVMNTAWYLSVSKTSSYIRTICKHIQLFFQLFLDVCTDLDSIMTFIIRLRVDLSAEVH